MDYRAALVDFYRKHNPIKLVEVDALLRKYRGREEELLHALRAKYKVNEKGESIEEPAPPPPPPRQSAPTPPPPAPTPPPPPPPPPPPREEPPPVEYESEEEPPQEPQEEEEPLVRPKRRDAEITRTVNDYSGDYKGRTAAERAEYWKKELERREIERQNRKSEEKPVEHRTKPKERLKVVREKVVEEQSEEEEVVEKKPFNIKLIAAIALGAVLLIAVAAALINDDIRHTIGAKLGLTKEETPAVDETKKEGIAPGALTDTTKKPSGDFALEEDEPEDKSNKAPVVEDAMNEKPSAQANQPVKKKAPAMEEQTDDSTPASDREAGAAVRKKFYIGCAAVTTEDIAKERVAELRRKGFDNAGYIYIPDYETGGKSLYRVHIGPYNTLEEAEEAAVNVRSESPSAYAYHLK